MIELFRCMFVAGLVVTPIGAVTTIRPIARIGLKNRPRAALVLTSGVVLAAAGFFVIELVLCPPGIACSHCGPSHDYAVRVRPATPSPSPASPEAPATPQTVDAQNGHQDVIYVRGCDGPAPRHGQLT